MSHSTLFYNVSVLTVSVFEITKEFHNAQGSSTMFRRCPVLAQICAEKKILCSHLRKVTRGRDTNNLFHDYIIVTSSEC